MHFRVGTQYLDCAPLKLLSFFSGLFRVVFFLALLFQMHLALSEEGDASALKSAFLFNFALYTEWPVLPGTFEFCIVGQDDLGGAVDVLSRKVILGRPIRVRRIRDFDALTCNLVFIAKSESARIGDILALLANLPVLTVADIGIEDNAGTMLQLQIENGRVGFSADQTAARAVGLNLSAKMLRIARSVH